MKALQITEYGEISKSLVFNDIKKPLISNDEVLIESKAASINPADKNIVQGYLKDSMSYSLPATVGLDVSGVILEKGKDITNFNIGDEVYSVSPLNQMGTLAEFVAINEKAVSLKPRNISFEEAASLPLVGLTALQCFEQVSVKRGEKVLIHAGSGGVGSFAIQYAKTKGAYVYTTTSKGNVHWVKNLGADRIIDYKTEDYKTIAKDVDIVLDTLGNDYTLDAFKVIKQGGRIVSIVGPFDVETAQRFGFSNYQFPNELSNLIEQKQVSYKFVFMNPIGKQLDEIRLLVEKESIKPIIDKVYSFSESITAFQHLASGRTKGKVVIKIK